MKVAVLQSSFVPWRGYFDLINRVDKFVFYDCVQYTKNDWRNRNKILSKNGVSWLTLPVKRTSSWCKVDEVTVGRHALAKAARSLENSYQRARHFDALEQAVIHILNNLCQLKADIKLTTINQSIIRSISSFYGISTEILCSSELNKFDPNAHEDKSERLLELLKSCEASHYLSGPAAKGYLDETSYMFNLAGITIDYIEYPQYSKYKQFDAAYVNNLSIVDFIAHCGNTKMPFI